MEDANIPSPEYDGQRAVLRRINNEDNATVPASYEDKNTSDTSLPVLEHVVTTSFARTVDHSAVDEKIENLFSACNMEDDQGIAGLQVYSYASLSMIVICSLEKRNSLHVFLSHSKHLSYPVLVILTVCFNVLHIVIQCYSCFRRRNKIFKFSVSVIRARASTTS